MFLWHVFTLSCIWDSERKVYLSQEDRIFILISCSPYSHIGMCNVNVYRNVGHGTASPHVKCWPVSPLESIRPMRVFSSCNTNWRVILLNRIFGHIGSHCFKVPVVFLTGGTHLTVKWLMYSGWKSIDCIRNTFQNVYPFASLPTQLESCFTETLHKTYQ